MDIPEQPNQSSSFQEQIEISSQKSYKKSGTITGLIIFLAFLLVGGVFLVNKTVNTKPPVQPATSQNKFIANSTLVYGSWINNLSIITAIDLSTGKEATLATLANNVKHIKILNNNSFLYINNTDDHDYGKELFLRSIDNNSDKTIIDADDNFGIDDYAVSPNGQYAAVWMVGNPTGSVQFSGNPSRVYTVNVATLEKHLIYDESSANGRTVHYPIAITNSGELFTDRFLPNSGVGWAYGMSVSDFNGELKKDIDSMQNGTYSSQPAISPDGKYLGFIGYDGADGATIIDGVRKVFANANTIELFDIATRTRTRIDNAISDALYSSVSWDKASGRLISNTVEKLEGKAVLFTYSYDTTTRNITKLPDTKTLDFVAILDNDNYLLAQRIQDNSWLGNLGASYSQGISKFSVMNVGATKLIEVPVKQIPIQLITIVPSKYFPIVEEKGLVVASSGEQLQLKTFALRSELASKRSNQQSEIPASSLPPTTDRPLCNQFFIAPCNKLLGTSYTKQEYWDCNKKRQEEIESRFNPSIPRFYDNVDAKFCDEFFASGFNQCADNLRIKETCYDSPLYLYGKNGTKVNVTVDTFTSNSNVSLINNSFNATLTDDKISVGSSLVDSISFDYESRVKKLLSPKSGYVFKRESVVYGVEKIASEFGLNFNETNDLLNFVKKIFSPYIFVSFYDQEMSHSILPLYFDPKPDNYRNIVFYFKKLDSLPLVLPSKPQIIPISRDGFTAIEISYMIR